MVEVECTGDEPRHGRVGPLGDRFEQLLGIAREQLVVAGEKPPHDIERAGRHLEVVAEDRGPERLEAPWRAQRPR
jgi:hypothetical protein